MALPVLLYDGECGLCNAVLRFLLRVDRSGSLSFASLQGETGQAFLRRRGLSPTEFSSVIFIPDLHRPDGPFYLRTTAVLQVLRQIGGPWRGVAAVFRLLPAPARDLLYNGVARVRYRLFGAYVPKPLPNPAWAARILP